MDARLVGGVVVGAGVPAALARAPLLHADAAVAGLARGNGGAQGVRRRARRARVGVAVRGGHGRGREDGVLVEVAAALVEVVRQWLAGAQGVVAGGVDGGDGAGAREDALGGHGHGALY